MSAAKKYTLDQAVKGLTSFVAKTAPLNNLHRSDRYKTSVDAYSVIGLIKQDEEQAELLGHIYKPKLADEIKYSVIYKSGQPPQITILNKVGNKAQALADIESEIILLYAKSLTIKPGKGGGGKGKKGYYLWTEVPQARGLQTFANAKAVGLVTDDFIQTCQKIKISMRFFK